MKVICRCLPRSQAEHVMRARGQARCEARGTHIEASGVPHKGTQQAARPSQGTRHVAGGFPRCQRKLVTTLNLTKFI